MTAKIVAVVNQKGGVGKTTVSMNLAGGMCFRGAKVLIIDADPQQGAFNWHSKGIKHPVLPEQFPRKVRGTRASIEVTTESTLVHEIIQAKVEEFDLIVVDTPPSVKSEQSQSALSVADLAIVPIRPGPNEIDALPGTELLMREVSLLNELLQVRFLLTDMETTNIKKQAAEVIAKMGAVHYRAQFKHRASYMECAAEGSSVHAFPLSDKGAREAIMEVEMFLEETCHLLGLSQFYRWTKSDPATATA